MTLQQLRKTGNRILIFAFILIISIFLCVWSCDRKQVILNTKEKKGNFNYVKPISNPVIITKAGKTEYRTEYIYSQYESKLIEQLQRDNEQLVNKFISSNDSLQRIILDQAIQINSFSQTWENNDLKATVSGISKGTVESIKLDYTIKPQSLKCPENTFRVLCGVEAGSNDDLNSFTAKVNLGFQNRKGNIFNIGFDTEQKIYAGYNITLIKF